MNNQGGFADLGGGKVLIPQAEVNLPGFSGTK